MYRIFEFIFIGMIAIVFIGIGVEFYATYGTQRTVTENVTGAQNVCRGSGKNQECKYLVYTDKTTYENVDNILVGKWNSSDIQGRVMAKGMWRLKINGWRLPLFSLYPNIISAERPS